MKIALIQQRASADVDDNLRRGVAAFRQAAAGGAQLIAYSDCDLGLIEKSQAKRHFLPDRRPDVYRRFGLTKER